MVGLLCFDRVFTYLPVPASGETREDIRAALRMSPRYERFLESWRWSVPLWRAGVIASRLDPAPATGSADPATEIAGASARIESAPPFKVVAGFLHKHMFRAGDTAPLALGPRPLDAVSADLLKGGPDPGVSVPIVAGLDQFAGRHGFVALRSGGVGQRRGGVASSLAQRAEERLAPTLLTVAVPVLSQCGANTLLAARTATKPLRIAFDTALKDLVAHRTPAAAAATRATARALADGLAAFFAPLEGKDDDSGKQVRSTFVRAALSIMPPDASLIAACAAARSLRGGPIVSPAQSSTGRGSKCDTDPPPFVALSVEPMSASPIGSAPARPADSFAPSPK